MKLFFTTLLTKIWQILNKYKINRLLSSKTNLEIDYFLSKLDPRLRVMIGLTYFCQCKCAHCGMGFFSKNKERELTTKEWINFIESLSFKKTKMVYFFGGEPLLRNDIFQLINKAKEKGFLTMLDTNGYLLSDAMAKKLKKAGLDVIEVSIDNSEAKIHDSLRGIEGVFERAVSGIKNCLKEKIFCILSTYATTEYIQSGELERIISLGEKLGVNQIRILSPVLTGKWLDKEKIKLNNKERKKIKEIIGKTSTFSFLEDEYCLSVNKKLLYISPYGEVQSCPYLPFSFGNIKEELLGKILKKIWKHPMFRIKTKKCLMNNEEFRRRYLGKLEQKFPVDLR